MSECCTLCVAHGCAAIFDRGLEIENVDPEKRRFSGPLERKCRKDSLTMLMQYFRIWKKLDFIFRRVMREPKVAIQHRFSSKQTSGSEYAYYENREILLASVIAATLKSGRAELEVKSERLISWSPNDSLVASADTGKDAQT